jgi:hypothetical protein
MRDTNAGGVAGRDLRFSSFAHMSEQLDEVALLLQQSKVIFKQNRMSLLPLLQKHQDVSVTLFALVMVTMLNDSISLKSELFLVSPTRERGWAYAHRGRWRMNQPRVLCSADLRPRLRVGLTTIGRHFRLF